MVTLDKINILPGKTHNSTKKIVMVCCHFLKLEILGRLLMSVFVQSVLGKCKDSSCSDVWSHMPE